MSRKKLAVFVAVHTYPEVAKLTIGSFLRAHQEYEIDLHLGCHSNYSDYCKDLGLFKDLRGLAQIHLVDEIDWLGAYNACWYRYSVMHAKNLENLFKQARYADFDQAVILDHDLFVKKDFITPLNERFPEADLIGCLFEDRAGLQPYETAHGEKVYSAPKISIWHSVLSRRLFDEIVGKSAIIYPKMLIEHKARQSYFHAHPQTEDRPVFVDTFAQVYHHVANGTDDLRAGVVSSSEFQASVDHFYNSSFNYGSWTRGDGYPEHIKKIIDVYRREFPKGFSEFRA